MEKKGKSRFLTPLLMLGCIVSGLVGCSRRWHRTRADTEVNSLIQEKGGYLDGGSVYADRASRLFDPFGPDTPPLPPDDPTSHQLMHWVDGKRGYKHWHKHGSTHSVESLQWLNLLPRQDDGSIRLDLRDAIGVARLNSRDYQQNIENLYRSALDVSFERFRFDHQFFGGNLVSADFRGRDRGGSSIFAVDSFGQTRRLTATGGELVVGLANSLVWDFWGTDSDIFTSTIDFSLVQPLLRFGGRARVLERLSQSERDLLANVRQMEQFRQGFYVNIATGRNSGSGPVLSGPVGQAGLGLIAGLPSGRGGAASPGGYLGLLEEQQRIRNQATNIVALRDSLAQLEAAFEANRISSRLQVDQARQALLNAQTGLLVSQAAYTTRVDSFKLELGLPPTLPVVIEDPLLDRFTLIDPSLTQLQDTLGEILLEIRMGRDQPDRSLILRALERLAELDAGIQTQLSGGAVDMQQLEQRLPQRREQLQGIKSLILQLNADVDSRVYDERSLLERIDFLKRRLPSITADLARLEQARTVLGESIEEDEWDVLWRATNELATELSDVLLELSLVRAELRLQSIVLLPLRIEVDDAIESARLNRLDWMNARANLVDVWRKIEFFANELKSDLNVFVNGELGTRPDNITAFSADRSRVRMGIQFDTPTARLAQRNQYREALIDYQRARRNYTLFEDRVALSLQNTLRIVTLSQINLEVRRAAVQVAIAQVDIARLRLNPPVQPNQPARAASPTAARDLVSALGDLLDAQNDFLGIWVSYEVLRVLLDFEMGTMQVDPLGVWIDPGPSMAIEKRTAPGREASENRDADDELPEIVPLPEGILDLGNAKPGTVGFVESIGDPVPISAAEPVRQQKSIR